MLLSSASLAGPTPRAPAASTAAADVFVEVEVEELVSSLLIWLAPAALPAERSTFEEEVGAQSMKRKLIGIA